ncbi:MAG: hypothetical protein ACTSYI_00625 [Promethearchaeota archaeon]
MNNSANFYSTLFQDNSKITTLLSSYKLPGYPIKIVGRSTKTKKRQDMKKLLQHVGKLFRNQYSPKEINSFDGCINIFYNFKILVEFLFDKQGQLLEKFKAIF